MKSIIRINIDNTMENININEKKNLKEELVKITNLKGYNSIVELYTWNKNVKSYGWMLGSNKNIHKLPPSGKTNNLSNIELSENIELYGDIFIICFKNSNIIDYNISEYGELYYILTTDDFKEFSNSSDEEIEINTEEKKIENIINDVEIINIHNDKLLDEDLNEYK